MSRNLNGPKMFEFSPNAHFDKIFFPKMSENEVNQEFTRKITIMTQKGLNVPLYWKFRKITFEKMLKARRDPMTRPYDVHSTIHKHMCINMLTYMHLISCLMLLWHQTHITGVVLWSMVQWWHSRSHENGGWT